jgi:hypothetical protein
LLNDSISKKRYLVAGVPFLFYTPETRFGLGGSAFCLFNFKNDSMDAAKSVVNIGFAFTQNKQILFGLPFNLMFRNRSRLIYGEVAFNRFNYNFYGVGNTNNPEFVENYGIEFPRIRITALKKIKPRFYAGPRFAYDNFTLYNLDSIGQLFSKLIPGSHGGVISGLGAVLMYDSRNNIYYPSKGIWSELVLYRNDKLTGGSFNYTRIAFDISGYLSYDKNILALNFYSIYANTDLPFFQMAMLGGSKKMRGFYEGRYRDNNLILFQAEYRRQLFSFLGFTLFADAGQVANRYNKFGNYNWRYTYGGGLRLMFDKRQKINLRMDFAVGNKKLLTYFTVAEAF